jgi:hypothetical protein
MSNQTISPYEMEIAEPVDENLVAQRMKNEAAIQLLREWREGSESDEQEQRETWEYLKQALDEHRLSARKLFP